MYLFLLALLDAPLVLILLIVIAMPHVPLGRRTRLWGLIWVALLASIVWTWWPFRLSFMLHKPWLAARADQVLSSGMTSTPPSRVGLIQFRQVRINSWDAAGNVGFQLTGGPGGGTYLVRRAPDAQMLWNNSDTLMNLGDEWFLVFED